MRSSRFGAIGLMSGLLHLVGALGLGVGHLVAQSGPPTPFPILFVTQVPVPGDFSTIGSVFSSHRGAIDSVTRGGDLWIRYPNGTLRNLTQLSGLGASGFQGATGIAVRDPSVHWDGAKAVFSMITGGATQQYQVGTWFWQLYEVTGLGPTDTPVITRVPNQPANANNVMPVYGTDDRIIFASDRPRDGQQQLYPQRDEYESTACVSGLWSLNPFTGDLFLMNHAPSGDFTPIVDSFGRVIFTQWDHMQRDQQADTDVLSGNTYGTFNWTGEAPGSVTTTSRTEVYPEPRPTRTDLLAGTNLVGHTFNHFFPWQINEDGTEPETLNHIGRHELHGYFDKSLYGDANLHEFISVTSGRVNPNDIGNFIQIREDPTAPGTYIGIDAPEFFTHASGQVIKLTAPPGANPDLAVITYVTHRDTASFTSTPGPNHSGHYREPLPLSDGQTVVVHTAETNSDQNIGTSTQPQSRYAFRLKVLQPQSPYAVAGATLTSGISKSVNWWSPDVSMSYSGVLWELNPVEVRPRPRPPRRFAALAQPEAAAIQAAGVDVTQLRTWMYLNGLALMVARNVTTRDDAERQQPFNLRVPGGVQTLGAGGTIYDVAHLQLFQGDLIRGYGGPTSPGAGRRVIAQPMHDGASFNPPDPTGPAASVSVAADGSVAAFVPARRAMTWQLTGPAGNGVVRERYWLTFQPGEIRACGSCHGINTASQAGLAPPVNAPVALTQLLQFWQSSTQASPALGSAGVGNTGVGEGGPFDVLTVNGSTGGAARRVDLGIGVPFAIAVSRPPSHAGTTHFALWGVLGAPTPAAAYSNFIGTMSFAPLSLAPFTAGAFTVANDFWADPTALVPSSGAPFAFSVPGLPIPATMTLQGVVEDSYLAPSPWGITNGVILRIQ